MQARQFFGPLKILSVIVLLAMVITAVYVFGISMVHWSGIGV